MSLVSNFVGEISASMFGGNSVKGVTQKLDMDDNTFENILEKQINSGINRNSSFGLNIGEIDGYSNTVGNVDRTDTDINIEKFNTAGNYTTSEILTFFPSVFNSKNHLTDVLSNGLYNFERKLAMNSYGKGAINIVTDISDFVTDALKIS